MDIIKIGTRGSKLALYQANRVKSELEKVYTDIDFQIEVIHTKGDKILDVALSKIGDKGLFTKEIEVALNAGDIDMAVHSLKDLPTVLEEPFEIGAVLKRDNFRDALVTLNGKKLSDLTVKDVIGTSSLRRIAGLLQYNSGFTIKDIRGNVNTRLKKLESGEYDALIMAAAGLERLRLDNYITEVLEPEVLVPAVAQGIIGVEVRKGDNEIIDILKPIHNDNTWQCAKAERAFMRTLEGGCQVPVGCYTKVMGDEFEINGFVASVDGKEAVKQNASGILKNAESISIELAKEIFNSGGKDILESIREK